MTTADPLIGIVGPCGAGKSTLEEGLKREGFRARAVVQEHSYVPDMWQRLTKPDLLVFLQASHTVCARRRRFSWTEAEWQEQQHRLRHARAHADLYLETDGLDPKQVLLQVMQFLRGE
jgi:deoxyadenosine/deoxycytidine kinase